jgi:hypothetical protein
MHPQPPADAEHWVTGNDGMMHVPGSNAVAECGHEADAQPVHYRQINVDADSEDEWRLENVCSDCLEALNTTTR